MAQDKQKKADQTEKEGKKIMQKQPLPEIKPGMTVKVHQKITEKGPKGDKERIQIFEGIVLSKSHGKHDGATITVRKISEGVGVEKIFPLAAPTVVKIEPVKQAKVKKAKLYYLRGYKKRLKEKSLVS